MREHYLEDRLIRIEAEIAGLSEIARARTMASVDMRPRIDKLEDQMRDVVLHRTLAEAIARRDPVAAEAACAQLIGEPPSAKRG